MLKLNFYKAINIVSLSLYFEETMLLEECIIITRENNKEKFKERIKTFFEMEKQGLLKIRMNRKIMENMLKE